jgi:hypothetical protein
MSDDLRKALKEARLQIACARRHDFAQRRDAAVRIIDQALASTPAFSSAQPTAQQDLRPALEATLGRLLNILFALECGDPKARIIGAAERAIAAIREVLGATPASSPAVTEEMIEKAAAWMFERKGCGLKWPTAVKVVADDFRTAARACLTAALAPEEGSP